VAVVVNLEEPRLVNQAARVVEEHFLAALEALAHQVKVMLVDQEQQLTQGQLAVVVVREQLDQMVLETYQVVMAVMDYLLQLAVPR
jgi:hypothetical protein